MADFGTVHESLADETLQLAEDILAALDTESARCHVLLAECHTILSLMDDPDGGGYVRRQAYGCVRPELLWRD